MLGGMHRVAILALDHVVSFDLAVPLEVFGWARLEGDRPAYEVVVCGPGATVSTGAFDLQLRHGLDALADAHTVIVPGTREPLAPLDPRVGAALRDAAGRGARVASVCSGAFVLAAAGLLDGRRATTHWLGAADLAARYPAITVDPDVLYVDEGAIATSAGAAAGLDLCLHLVRRDFGAEVAARVARLSVMPLERAGGQAQFIEHAPPEPHESLEPLMRWMEARVDQELTLARIAAEGLMSQRTLSRRFREQAGTTPLQWLLRARVRQAQRLLETTDLDMASVAARVGFGSVSTFRDRFRRVLGVSPQGYRKAFNVPGA